MSDNDIVSCQICHTEVPREEAMRGDGLRPTLAQFIEKSQPSWQESEYICLADLGRFRRDYVQSTLVEEIGELSDLDKEVVESLKERELLSTNIGAEFVRQLTFGERLSDKIASFGGSWPFIIIFAVILFGWLGINSLILRSNAFDPYPYILMNLILSCLAAIQAPIIMMSQNRGEERDRLRGENDYKINLKAELEIRHLHEKLDHLLQRQYHRLFEIQQIQIELLQNLNRESSGKASPTKS